jgi:hypothetical protein
MRIFLHRESVSCTASRPCTGCGKREHRPFRQLSGDDPAAALDILRERVRDWQGEPRECGTCSERLAPPC